MFAAASLKSTFTEIGDQFKASHPGVTVTFSFAGSSDLVTQIQGGAPADVFASADTKNMDKATADNLVDGTPVNFASNTMEIAVPPGQPGQDRFAAGPDQAGREGGGLRARGAVRIGNAEDRDGQRGRPEAGQRRGVGDRRAEQGDQPRRPTPGMVYVTDVKGAGDKVEGVTFPESNEAVNVYPIATLAGSKNKDLAKQFVAAVTGEEGQQVLADAGFARPVRAMRRASIYSGLPRWLYVPAVVGGGVRGAAAGGHGHAGSTGRDSSS